MNYFEAIKEMDIHQMANLLRVIEHTSIPKKYSCNSLCCRDCKEDLCCYVKWLEQEVKEE